MSPSPRVSLPFWRRLGVSVGACVQASKHANLISAHPRHLLSPAATTRSSATTRRTETTRSRSAFFLGPEVDKKQLLKQAAKSQSGDVCIGLKSANSGYRFKTAKEGVTFERCADGRDCVRMIDCKESDNALCLQAFECEDLVGKNRCLKFQPCQCLSGDFQVFPAATGFQVEVNTPALDPKDLGETTEVGILGIFYQEQCFDGDSFNLRACDIKDERCINLIACESEPGEKDCLSLLPGGFVPETTDAPSTEEPTTGDSTTATATL